MQEEKAEREAEQITTVYDYMAGNMSMTDGGGERRGGERGEIILIVIVKERKSEQDKNREGEKCTALSCRRMQ